MPDGQDWPAQLAARHPASQVINLGVCGYGVDKMHITLREVVEEYKPHLVIVAPISENFNRSLLTIRDYAKPRFSLSDDGSLQLHNTPVPAYATLLDSLKSEYGTWRPSARLRVENQEFLASVDRGDYEAEWKALNQRLLEESVAVARAHASYFLFVHLASYLELEAHDSKVSGLLPAEQVMQLVADNLHVPFLRTRESFLAKGNTWAKGHYGPAECTFVSHWVFNALQESPAWKRFTEEHLAPLPLNH